VPFLERTFDVHTLTLPTTQVLRDRPVALLRHQHHYRTLARQSDAYDVTLLQFITFWNGTRAAENMLPTFIRNLRRPIVAVLHEWPTAADPGATPARARARLALSALSRLVDPAAGYERFLRDTLLPRVAHFVVHSNELRSRLIAHGVADTRITSTALPPFPATPTDGVRSRFVDAIGTRRVVLLLGFPHPRKNYELAIQALPQLPDDVQLVMAGDSSGPLRSQYVASLHALAASLGVASRVLATGRLTEDELHDLVGRATVGVAPYTYATGSAAIAQLFGARVPVVASNLDSNTVIHDLGGGLILFRSGDVDSLAGALNQVLRDDGLRHSLSERSRAFAERLSFAGLGEIVTGRLLEAWQHDGHSR
jgi:glycosyltransferase involved in cell wall biosynthesis